MTESETKATAVSVTELGFYYRPGYWIVRNLGFEVRAGTIYAIMGQNGCGKTTLMRIILGSLKAAEGGEKPPGPWPWYPRLSRPSSASPPWTWS